MNRNSVYDAISQPGGFGRAAHYAATSAALEALREELEGAEAAEERCTTPSPSARTVPCGGGQ